ncbi:MAG: RNA-binding S4 domain-containing protein [Bacteroidetes bacterium]|nr:RNA-binding S4 domain-containing protein [Bacteroidota bacterium]
MVFRYKSISDKNNKVESIRIDKWLWTVRLFKTRNIAAEACKGGKVKIDGKVVKPSRDIKVGDLISIQQTPIIKEVKVLQIIKNRVSAKLAVESVEDITPKEEYDKLKMMNELNYERRDRGAGRPTKKERRTIGKLKKI